MKQKSTSNNMAAAEPILASSLWSAEQEVTSLTSPPPKRRKLATGCPSIDDSLQGGFDHGSTTCISAEADSGAKDLSYSLIAAHLLNSNRAEATVVDTTNSFDVRRLHKRLVAGLMREEDRVVGGDGGGVKHEAIKMLERARIMKAFDFVGLTECVTELRESLETPSNRESSPRQQRVPAPPRGTVGDSEDEDEEEMLDAPASPTKPTATSPEDTHSQTQKSDRPSHLLIIDNITYVTSPILKNNHVQGQALLKTFMRSLAHVTQRHDICTIIHNTTVTYPNNNTSNSNNSPTPAEPTPSIFASCAVRPALGKSFPYLLDVHLLLHRLPISASDAKAVYAAHGAIPKPENKLASVLEVMHDRYSDRVGRWSAFRVDAEGNLTGVSV
jgi:hypothetical protein